MAHQISPEDHWHTLSLQELKAVHIESEKYKSNKKKQAPQNYIKRKTLVSDAQSFLRASKRKVKPPIQVSSKKPFNCETAYQKKTTSSLRNQARDPRFSELSGYLNEKLASDSYKFINTLRQKEKLILKEIVSSGKKPIDFDLNEMNFEDFDKLISMKRIKATLDEQFQASKKLKQLESQDTLRKSKTKFSNLKHELQAEESIKIAKGIKKPFYLSHSQLRKSLVERKSQSKRNLQNHRKEKKERTKDKLFKRIPTRKYGNGQ